MSTEVPNYPVSLANGTLRAPGKGALLIGLLFAFGHCVAGDLGIVVQTTSDWTYHGTSESSGEPAVGLNSEWQVNEKVFLGLEGHQAIVMGAPQRQRSLMAYVGSGQKISNRWYATVSLQHREFPGSAKEWDFSELELEFAYLDRWSIKLDYSPDYYEHDTEAVGLEISHTRRLSQDSYWYFLAGNLVTSESQFPNYHYAQLGAGFSFSSLNLDLSYGWNSANNEARFGGEIIQSPGLVLQMSYRVR